jgi:hypothetical protein
MCLKDYREIIWLFCQKYPALLHWNIIPTHLGHLHQDQDRHDAGQQWKGGIGSVLKLWMSPHCRMCPMTTRRLMLIVTILWPVVVPKAKTQAAWMKLNTPWTDLVKGWFGPTSVNSICLIKSQWRGFCSECSGALGRDRTAQYNCKIDRSTSSRQLVNFWQYHRTGWDEKVFKTLNGSSHSVWKCIWQNVWAWFKLQRGLKQLATSNRLQIGESTWQMKQQVPIWSWQIHYS